MSFRIITNFAALPIAVKHWNLFCCCENTVLSPKAISFLTLSNLANRMCPSSGGEAGPPTVGN